MTNLLAALLAVGSVALLYEDTYFQQRPMTRDDVASYATSPIPLHQCEALAKALRAAGGFAVCYPEDAR